MSEVQKHIDFDSPIRIPENKTQEVPKGHKVLSQIQNTEAANLSDVNSILDRIENSKNL